MFNEIPLQEAGPIPMPLARVWLGAVFCWGFVLLTGAALFMLPMALGIEGVPIVTRAESWMSLFVVGVLLRGTDLILLYWRLLRVGAASVSTAAFSREFQRCRGVSGRQVKFCWSSI